MSALSEKCISEFTTWAVGFCCDPFCLVKKTVLTKSCLIFNFNLFYGIITIIILALF
uniref:Uncharacterized protein n=1 Tax=Anguilla anguilla TaxID=7936 RepID=A0A0E9QQ87_ANGAN